MLSIRAQLTANNAKSYFKEHLQVGDYYSEGQAIAGKWIGKGAALLNLEGIVKEQIFLNLVDGLHPETGNKLLQRLNSVRHNKNTHESNRRYFYDVCFSPPKSVSVMGLLEDPKIVAIHTLCVEKALGLLEQYAATRVRRGGQNTDRRTGNVIGALFQHDTSRSLDPQLHTHCILLNATYDAEEKKWKALQAVDIVKVQKYIHMHYLDLLAKELQAIGYSLERNEKGFEIKGVEPGVIKKFSKRLEQIETLYVVEKDKVENQHRSPEALKSQIAYDKRTRKLKHQSLADLRAKWLSEMTEQEQTALNDMREQAAERIRTHTLSTHEITLEAAFDRAESIIFERKTLSTKEELLAKVLEVSLGSEHTLEAIQNFYDIRQYVVDPISKKLTLVLTLEREKAIVQAVANGKERYKAFLSMPHLDANSLSTEQRLCVEGILGSRDFAVFFKGSAGTGKSHTLKVLTECLENAGHTVELLAPQRQQVKDLEKEDLAVQTVSSFVMKQNVQAGSVWIIDEAGQIGGRQMQKLLELAKENNCRVIFSGDTKQHGAVEASDALIALEKYAKIQTFDLNEVRRQDPLRGKTKEEQFQILCYKKAVCHAARGNARRSLKTLQALGWVQELPKLKAQEQIAKDYAAKLQQGKSCLVISQTREAVTQLNMAIHSELKEEGRLGSEIEVKVFKAKDKLLEERKDSAHYAVGDYVLFHKNYGEITKGNLLQVVGKTDQCLLLEKDDKVVQMSLKYGSYFNLYTAQEQPIAQGERLQLKLNGTSQEGHKISNGELVEFLGVTEANELKVKDEQGVEKTLTKDQAVFDLGYAVTSYASQGKTVDSMLIYDSQNKLAVNKKEWYVSISRGRNEVQVYTTDKAALTQNVQQKGERVLGLDLEHAITQAIELGKALEYSRNVNEKAKAQSLEYAMD
jgi:conjugative relaxase-like TrwC/TraI family protein